jgi:hypothetical protein
MKKRRLASRSLTSESLEPRELLSAGNVSVFTQNGVTVIRGDAEPNSIIVEGARNGRLLIMGSASDGGITTINGQSSLVIRPEGTVRFEMGGGNDRIVTRNNSRAPLPVLGSVSFDMGTGTDALTASYLKVTGTMTINTGSGTHTGYDTASVESCNLGSLSCSMPRSTGSNYLNLFNTIVSNSVTVNGSDGTDAVNIASSKIGGGVWMAMGNESNSSTKTDTVSVGYTDIRSGVELRMGSGRGNISLSKVSAASIDAYFGGYDADGLNINSCTFGRVNLDGGSGRLDRIAGRGNIFGSRPKILGFESNLLQWT